MLIQVCKQTFPAANFETVEPFPPTSLPAGSFDLVFAYSVFSHLSEAAATAWVEEAATSQTGWSILLHDSA